MYFTYFIVINISSCHTSYLTDEDSQNLDRFSGMFKVTQQVNIGARIPNQII